MADSNITERRRQAEASSPPSMTDPRRLTQLRTYMVYAELESRIAVAQVKAAVARRNFKLLDFESLTLEQKSSRIKHLLSEACGVAQIHWTSAFAGYLPGEFMALLQTIQDNAQAQQQRADEWAER